MNQPDLAAVVARIRQMADYWEKNLPEVIRTPAVVSALRAAMEPAAQSPADRTALRDRIVAAIKAAPFTELRARDYANGPLQITVGVEDLADVLLRRLAGEQPAQDEARRQWCKCRSCWGWFVEDHPGEDLDELGKDLGWWSGLPEHRDPPSA